MKKKYKLELEFDEELMNKIRLSVRMSSKGRTIKDIMQDTKSSRGSLLKIYLSALVTNKEINEVNYNQDTKIYFWK